MPTQTRGRPARARSTRCRPTRAITRVLTVLRTRCASDPAGAPAVRSRRSQRAQATGGRPAAQRSNALSDPAVIRRRALCMCELRPPCPIQSSVRTAAQGEVHPPKASFAGRAIRGPCHPAMDSQQGRAAPDAGTSADQVADIPSTQPKHVLRLTLRAPPRVHGTTTRKRHGPEYGRPAHPLEVPWPARAPPTPVSYAQLPRRRYIAYRKIGSALHDLDYGFPRQSAASFEADASSRPRACREV